MCLCVNCAQEVQNAIVLLIKGIEGGRGSGEGVEKPVEEWSLRMTGHCPTNVPKGNVGNFLTFKFHQKKKQNETRISKLN